MRMTSFRANKEETFAKIAAKAFASDPDLKTFVYGDLTKGCLLALRWGADVDCVVVVKLDDYHEPTNYQQVIPAGRVYATSKMGDESEVLREPL
jgi:hypothetical protein